MNIPADVSAVLTRLCDAGYDAVAVGGCVRDSLLGKTPDDWDAASSATPEEAHFVLRDYPVIDTGVQHGTVTVLTGSRAVELTTFRTESGVADHRHPAKLAFSTSLTEDLSRRDFTVNAMAVRQSGELVDLFGGRQDLERRLIRAVGDPRLRLEEDALRIFRGVRFAATLGFTVEPKTAAAIAEMAPLLREVAVERMQTELAKWIVTDHALETMRRHPAVFEQGLPPLEGIRVSDKRLDILPLLPQDPDFRLAALLATTPDPAKALSGWRLSRGSTNAIAQWLAHWDDPIPADRVAVRRCLSCRRDAAWWRKLWGKQGISDPQTAQTANRLLDAVLRDGDPVAVSDLSVSGTDLLAWGVPVGQAVGETMAALLDAVMADACRNTLEDLQDFFKKMQIPS